MILLPFDIAYKKGNRNALREANRYNYSGIIQFLNREIMRMQKENKLVLKNALRHEYLEIANYLKGINKKFN